MIKWTSIIVQALLISFVVGTEFFGDVKRIPRSRTCEESDSSSGQIDDKVATKLVGDGDSCIYRINIIDSNFIRIKLHGLSFGTSCQKDFGLNKLGHFYLVQRCTNLVCKPETLFVRDCRIKYFIESKIGLFLLGSVPSNQWIFIP